MCSFPGGRQPLMVLAALLLAAGARLGAADSQPVPSDVVTRQIVVNRPEGPLTLQVELPPESRRARRPILLLNFSGDRASSLHQGVLGEPARVFLAQGHPVASFDLPAHGERVDRHGSAIAGLCARFLAGDDPFLRFVADARAAIDECLRQGLAEPGRIVACGVSRAGYCVLRLAAAEPRLEAVAALAPVTDWRALTEFAAVRDRPDVAELSLDRFAEGLVGRRVYIAIGNADGRVSTAACTRLVLAVNAAEERRGVSRSLLRYELVDDTEGHALANRWRREGAFFLLRALGEAVAP